MIIAQISGKLQKFAEEYKASNIKARKEKKPKSTKGLDVGGANSTKSGGGTSRDSYDHNENWTFLLPKININLKNPKIQALIYESSVLSVDKCYAASMLFRSIIELALFENIKLSGNYPAVCQMVFDEQDRSGRPFSEEAKKLFRPTLRNALDWLNAHNDYFPQEIRRDCINARNKLAKHLKELNGVVHEGDLTDSGKLKTIRNDTMPLLLFLLGCSSRSDD